MLKNIVLISVQKRNFVSVQVQEVLTEFGCLIKTRLGIHGAESKSCSEKGLIILECVGPGKKISSLVKKLASIKGVNAKLTAI